MLTLTDSGAMAGYCETGRRKMARAPPSITRMATTQAKIGRSMKNWATGRPYFDPEAGTGFTRAPGRTFCTPSTMT